uniref:Uncharacterized protein n=1 Tax=Accipiter nisus TaxID=211598 RepID=A0A8B9MA78_9AVES
EIIVENICIQLFNVTVFVFLLSCSNAPLAFSSKVCYIKFREASSVGVAQHLTNTVFIDRALIVVPCAEVMQPTRTVVMCKTTFDHRENTALGKRPCLISFGS